MVISMSSFIWNNLPAFIILTMFSNFESLKQAPREWYRKLTGQLLQLSFHGSKTDTSLCYTTSGALYLLIYVDDILIMVCLSLKSTPSLPLSNTISVSKISDPHLDSSELNFRNTVTVSHLLNLSIHYLFSNC